MDYKLFIFLILFSFSLNESFSTQNPKAEGYKGIWFTVGQFSEFGDKCSGGLGTYTANHIPVAIYSPEVNKTFFVYEFSPSRLYSTNKKGDKVWMLPDHMKGDTASPERVP